VPTPRPPQSEDEYGIRDEAVDRRAAAGDVRPADFAGEGAGPDPVQPRRSALKWDLFLGGFGFPWTPGAVARWVLISVWAVVTLWLARLAGSLGIGGAGPAGNDMLVFGGVVAGVLTAMGALVFGTVTAALAAIHGLTILSETSAGNDRIECWPNIGLFLEWIGNLFYVFNAAAICVALAVGLGWLLPGARAALIGLTTFFLFPFLLLCELESDSPFLPASALVLASIRRQGLSWLLFYVEAACLLLAAGALANFARPRIDSRLGVLLGGMMFAAVVMIYFRLLGRLAWFCSIETDETEEEETGGEQQTLDDP
jgi:hypothetical protein